MSNGRHWGSGYRPSRSHGRTFACGVGRAKCWVCSRPDLVAYRDGRHLSLSDSLSDLVDDLESV